MVSARLSWRASLGLSGVGGQGLAPKPAKLRAESATLYSQTRWEAACQRPGGAQAAADGTHAPGLSGSAVVAVLLHCSALCGVGVSRMCPQGHQPRTHGQLQAQSLPQREPTVRVLHHQHRHWAEEVGEERRWWRRRGSRGSKGRFDRRDRRRAHERCVCVAFAHLEGATERGELLYGTNEASCRTTRFETQRLRTPCCKPLAGACPAGLSSREVLPPAAQGFTGARSGAELSRRSSPGCAALSRRPTERPG